MIHGPIFRVISTIGRIAGISIYLVGTQVCAFLRNPHMNYARRPNRRTLMHAGTESIRKLLIVDWGG